MTQFLAIGGLLVATTLAGRLGAQSKEVWLLQNEPLRDRTALGVAHQPDQTLVSVHWWTPDRTPLPDMVVRAWLLKPDGTALSRSRPEQKVMTWGKRSETGSGATWRSTFSFAPADQRDLAAVVVSLDGTLFVRPIPQKPSN